MEPYIVKKSVVIKAPASAVWEALTNPEKTKKYFFNCGVYSDWKVGSPLIFKGKIFWIKDIEMHGQILKIEPEKLLQYSLKNESRGEVKSVSTVTDELLYYNGETVLTITDDVGQDEGAKERFERSEKGWEKVLKGLKELVEKETETT